MPSVDYFLICESLCIDRDTGALSIFNILEDIRIKPNLEELPELSRFALVASIRKNPGEEFDRLRIGVEVDGDPNGPAPVELEVDFVVDRRVLTLRFDGGPTLDPGDLRFNLRLNDDICATHVVRVAVANLD